MAQHFLRYGDESLAVAGSFPETGQILPSFMLVDEHLRDVSLEAFLGRTKLVLTLLSLDAEQGGLALLQELRRKLEGWSLLQFIVISVDSPFSLHRSRKEHGLPNVVLLSTLRGRDFHKHFGVLLQDYPLAGMTCPALWLVDDNDRILYAQRLDDVDDDFDLARIRSALLSTQQALPGSQPA
ncbi:redoxin family protein [Vogesella sp. LIG4]|uniref:redoxin family protein n=1 Tax=Vogesella sp. LIG4 TaxID=1192162 RepID=UPI00081F8E32|nr:redoxin family protein [Vogesella sp. LIG4]SCK07335.1 thiol peroxidase, atypical 2-Cys peroxiredoxin [Vogesella sp. LIG4]